MRRLLQTQGRGEAQADKQRAEGQKKQQQETDSRRPTAGEKKGAGCGREYAGQAESTGADSSEQPEGHTGRAGRTGQGAQGSSSPTHRRPHMRATLPLSWEAQTVTLDAKAQLLSHSLHIAAQNSFQFTTRTTSKPKEGSVPQNRWYDDDCKVLRQCWHS